MIFSYGTDTIYFALKEDDFDYNYPYIDPKEENLPCWHPHDGMLINVETSNYRILDLIRYYVKIPSELSVATLRDFYDDVWEALQDNGYTKEDEYSLCITIANSSEAYCVSKFGITTRDDKLTYVSGRMSPEIAANLPRDLSPVERIKAYYRAENEFYKTNNTEIMLFSTDEPGVKIINL